MPAITIKQKKYLETHPLVEIYHGWKIRFHTWESKTIGTQQGYTVDVRVGVESCLTSTIEQAREFIDEKIKQGKIQQEDF